MKIIVMGAGALGSIAAALLHEAGNEVALVARGARAEHLKANGVTVEGHANLTARVPIVTDPGTLTDADLVLLAVKTFSNDEALAQLAHVKTAMCFSVQNGMKKEDELAATFGKETVLLSTANFSGGVRDDGVTLFTVNLGITLGEMDGIVSERVNQVCDAFEAAGIRMIPSAETLSAAWTKFVMWCASALTCGLSGKTTGNILTDPNGALLAARIMREAAAVAAAEGAVVGEVDPYDVGAIAGAADEQAAAAFVHQAGEVFAKNMPLHKPSILQALEAGKPLEIEATLADVIARAERHGIQVPAIDAGYRLLAAIDRISAAEA